MSRRKKEALRSLTAAEKSQLEQLSRAQNEPASHVIRAKQLLAVAQGHDYTEAARLSGRKSGDAVAKLVKRFNEEGLRALQARHGGGPPVKYGVAQWERILQEVRRKPEPEQDGTATWSLKTLQQALQQASDGLPEVSEDTIRTVLLEAGFSWQQNRSWCQTGQVVRIRKSGRVVVVDPDTTAKRS
jgi:transposase